MTDNPVLLFELALLLVVIGGVGGFLSGLLGVGGGLIYVPALFFTLTALGFGGEHAMHIAIGTSLAIVTVTVAASSRAYHKRGSVDLKIVQDWGPYIAFGVLSGALIAGSADGDFLKALFASLTLLVVIYMVVGKEKPEGSQPKWFTFTVQRICSIFVGLVAAMTGMGGAIMTVPMMSLRGLPMQKASGTGAALGLMTALPGAIGYAYTGLNVEGLPPYSVGFVNMVILAFVMPLSIAFAPIGVKVAHKMGRVLLRRIFAGIVLAVSIKMFMSL